MAMVLRGIELRYVLTWALAVSGPMTVAELVAELARQGFTVSGRSAKSVSDALRWEVGHGRVRRLGRGRYGPGPIPRSTEYRIAARVSALRSLAADRAAIDLLFDDECA